MDEQKSLRRLTFVIFSVIGLFAILSSTMSKSPILPLFAEYLGADVREIGLIAAASTIPGILVSLPAGALSDIYGRRRVIVASLLIFSSAPFLYLLVVTPWQLAVVRFYHGFATAIFGPVMMAAIAEKYTKQRGERMALFSSVTLVGRSIAPVLGGTLLLIASFHAVYLACAISACLALLTALLLPKDETSLPSRPNTNNQKPIQIMQGLREVVGNFKILLTSSMEATQFFVYGAVEVFLVLYTKSVGLDELQIGIILTIPIVVAGITKPKFGQISDRIGRKPLIVTGFIVEAGAVVMFQLFTTFLPLVFVSVVFGLCFAAVTAATSAFVADVCKDGSFGAALGTMSTIMDIGQTAGPPIIGFVVYTYDYGMAFTLLGVILLLTGIIFFFGIKESKRNIKTI